MKGNILFRRRSGLRGEESVKNNKLRTYLAAGALTGAANGLFGGGGGMIAVPFLERSSLSVRRAHASAIAVVAPASLVSGALYAAAGLVPLGVFLPVALGVTAGGYLGAKLLGILPARITGALFAVLMLAAGLRMVF